MVQLVIRLRWLLPWALAALALAGCARQPDAAFVRDAVQQQLDAAFGGRVLQVERFSRAGSQTLSGREGQLVYFNAELKLQSDYNFSDWDKHNVTTLASLLGAGPKGIVGLKADGNQAGNLLGVYGSAAFVSEDGKTWKLIPTAPAQELVAANSPAETGASIRPRAKEIPEPSAAEVAIDQLRSLLVSKPGATPSAAEREAIVTEAARTAYHDATARLQRVENTLVLADGPNGGVYEEVERAISERAAKTGIAFEARNSEGSLGNIRLLAGGSAQFALVQSDIAIAALHGRGRFGGAAQPDLRAVASLFPEAVQLVVRADGPIRSISDLKGQRVDVGLERSGTRANALAILTAHGVPFDTLAGTSGSTLADAAALLGAGKIDALFTTSHAPARALQTLAAKTRLAFIDILPTDALRESGLVPLKLPARTYAGQAEPVQTLAVTALLVTRADVPAGQVAAMLKLLFPAGGVQRFESSAIEQITMRSAHEGVSIPWHPAAEAFLAKASALPAK